MFLVALTGGIAAGKSEVAKRLVALGAIEIDADLIAREVVAPGTEGLSKTVEHFGTNLILSDGSLDRKALGNIVFQDAQKRAQLEAILHPLIKARTKELLSQANREIIIYSVPLLLEAKVDHDFDLIVTVEAGESIQKMRLIESRGMSEADASARLASQVSSDARKQAADVVIDSSGSIDSLQQQVEKLWTIILERKKQKEIELATD